MNVTVIVYRAEAGYFAHVQGWQRGLARELTRKYWDRAETGDPDDEPGLEFASDEDVERFWRNLDIEDFNERFTLAIETRTSTASLIAMAMKQARRAGKGGKLYSLLRREKLYGLFHLESGAKVKKGWRLEDYAIEDGDHLGLIIQYPPRGLYKLIPLPDSETVFAAIRSTDAQPPTSDIERRELKLTAADSSASGSEPLRGALLYTDEDTEIATYVRKHFASLSEASGPNLRFYVIEQPESDWREASRYWKGIIDEQLQREWVTLGWLRTKPYRPEQAYQVARQLGVYTNQLPCLVLFEHLSDAEKLVFPLLDGSAAFFRELFAQLQRLILPDASSELTFAGLRREYGSIVEELRKVGEATVTSNSVMYKTGDQTVIINNPRGPVNLSDFQKHSTEAVAAPSDHDESEGFFLWRTPWRRAGTILVGLAGIAGAVAGILALFIR